MEFSITGDRGRRLIRARVEGMFSVEELQRFRREHQAAVRALGGPSGGYDMITDLTGFAIQAQPITQTLHSVIADLPLRPTRSAIVVSSVLLRLQLKRTIPNDKIRFFDTVAEADLWLKTPT